MISSLLHKFYLVAANLLIPAAILTFSRGFFPYKPFLPGFAQYDNSQSGPLQAPFDKVIFMVVDALRSDFVYGNYSGFDFTRSLIEKGFAIPFTAHARPPTITMPRIKALSTGSIPSFIDVILNFAESDRTSSLTTQDSWLAQMKAKRSGKVIMFGDDTWLKLFPETFDRADGTSSFFVSDFTEVDNNVTRNIPRELENQDWNTMILHYLGVDHIGHKAGPRSPNMIPKLTEMDVIVGQIYEALLSKEHLHSTILILLGDHGMNEAGNHGGSSPGETSPALIFISPKLNTISIGSNVPPSYHENFRYYSFIEQSDIVPTLGALLGFPIPKNNLGIFIPQFLPFWSSGNEKSQIYLQNLKQILQLLKATFPSNIYDDNRKNCDELLDVIDKLVCQSRVIIQNLPENFGDEQNLDTWLQEITKWLKTAQETMSNVASNYDVSKLTIGLSIAILALGLSLLAAGPTIFREIGNSFPFLFVSLTYGIMMFSSSYVEEEQQFWFWITSAWLGLLWIKCFRKKGIGKHLMWLALLAVKIATRWNQTGQKLAGRPDIAKTLLPKHRTSLWLLVIITHLWDLRNIKSLKFSVYSHFIFNIITIFMSIFAISFKLAFANEESPEIIGDSLRKVSRMNFGLSIISRARILFLLLAIALLYTVLISSKNTKASHQKIHTIHNLLSLLLFTQSRVENIPLLLSFKTLSFLIYKLHLDAIETVTTSLLLQHTSFFSFGGSNAISSIDLSNAYNGISGFNAWTVGILAFISNWTGPIFWTSATNLMLIRLHRRGAKRLMYSHLAFFTLFVTSSLVSVMAACILLRTHLFIWTVFSPKFLYSIAWSLGQHICINLGLGSLLFWIGTR